MSRFETSNYEKRDGIAYITLNQPESLNIYNIQMRDDLNEILRALKDDREVKVGKGDLRRRIRLEAHHIGDIEGLPPEGGPRSGAHTRPVGHHIG